MAKFDDELDVLPTSKPSASNASTATATAEPEEAAAPVKSHVVEDDGEVAVATEPAKKAHVVTEADDVVTSVKFGDSKIMAKGDGLNRIRAEKGKVVRFALLDFIDPYSAKSHFVDTKDKKGTFICLPAKKDEIPYCCTKMEEEGMLHVVALAVLYTNADTKTGKYAAGTPIEWEVGYVDLSRSNYRSVSNLAPEDSSVFDIDLVMSKKENGIGYEFVLCATKAKWKLNAELAEEVKEAAQKYVKDGGKKLKNKLGRSITLNEWKLMLAGQAKSGAEASLDDIEELS